MGSPTLPTVKRLSSVSGNCCAFPKCTLPNVDAATGKVTGRICHIKARQSGGPRYDAKQTDEQRHSFENLILLCPIHHDVVDADSDSYTVERLTEMKVDHENAQKPQPEISYIEGNTVTHGSIIFNQNQLGGQVAHSIQNFGPQPRQVSRAAANLLVSELRKQPTESIDLCCVMGDTEGYQLASILKQVLELAGWTINGVNQCVYSVPVRGVIVETNAARPSLQVLANWLGGAELKPIGNLNPNATQVTVVVGANL